MILKCWRMNSGRAVSSVNLILRYSNDFSQPGSNAFGFGLNKKKVSLKVRDSVGGWYSLNLWPFQCIQFSTGRLFLLYFENKYSWQQTKPTQFQRRHFVTVFSPNDQNLMWAPSSSTVINHFQKGRHGPKTAPKLSGTTLNQAGQEGRSDLLGDSWRKLLHLWSAVHMWWAWVTFLCSCTLQCTSYFVWSTEVTSYFDFLRQVMKRVWNMLKVQTGLESRTVGQWRQHLRWMSWNILFLRVLCLNEAKRNYVFFDRLWISCFMPCSNCTRRAFGFDVRWGSK